MLRLCYVAGHARPLKSTRADIQSVCRKSQFVSDVANCRQSGIDLAIGSFKMQCAHLDQVRDVRPVTNGCEECLKSGDAWVHLRLCLTCGHVGCCDSSKNKHATKQFHQTTHPIIRSAEPGEDWGWCYIDEVQLDF